MRFLIIMDSPSHLQPLLKRGGGKTKSQTFTLRNDLAGVPYKPRPVSREGRRGWILAGAWVQILLGDSGQVTLPLCVFVFSPVNGAGKSTYVSQGCCQE